MYQINACLGESARLVREDVLDLAEIVGQVPTPGECRLIRLCIPNVRIEIYKSGLTRSHKLDGNVQRNRDNILEPKRELGPGKERSNQTD